MRLKNHLLIAMPNLKDPNFSRSVTLICEHDEQGAIGLILNHAATFHLQELLQQLNIECAAEATKQRLVMRGGPVNPEHGFVLHRPLGNWQNSLAVNPEVGLTSSLDVLQALTNNNGPQDVIIALGYAGWAAGQLEHELSCNSWLTHPADNDILFNTPADQLWDTAAKAIGVDIKLLTHDAGHA